MPRRPNFCNLFPAQDPRRRNEDHRRQGAPLQDHVAPLQGKYGYSIYPLELLRTEPEETTTLLELETDTGVSGYWFPRGGGRLTPWIEALAIGRDPMDREQFWQLSGGDMPLDMLLWDFAGRFLEQPVHKLLGGFRDKLKCYASSYPNMGPPEVFADHAEECVKKGYTAYKIHAYMWYDPVRMEPAPRSPAFPKHDVEVCEAVRERVGGDIVLMLDQAGIYNYEQGALRRQGDRQTRFLLVREPDAGEQHRALHPPDGEPRCAGLRP